MNDINKHVICMKWGTLYDADYVNVLYRAVGDHLSEPFNFICFTDDTEGLADGIIGLPIPDIGLPQQPLEGRRVAEDLCISRRPSRVYRNSSVH